MIDPLEIQALADGELTAEEAETLRARIAVCQRSSTELHTVQTLKDLLHDRCETYTCEVTWSKCVSRLDALDKTKRVEHFVGRYAWGLCGAFALVIAVGSYWTRESHTGVIASGDVPKVAAGMVALPGRPTLSAIRKWVGDKLGITPEMSDRNMQVTRCYEGRINGMPAVRLSLHDNAGDADLLIVRGAQAVDGVRPLPEGIFSAARVDDQNLVTWTRDGNALFLVAPRPVEDLVAVASGIRMR